MADLKIKLGLKTSLGLSPLRGLGFTRGLRISLTPTSYLINYESPQITYIYSVSGQKPDKAGNMNQQNKIKFLIDPLPL